MVSVVNVERRFIVSTLIVQCQRSTQERVCKTRFEKDHARDARDVTAFNFNVPLLHHLAISVE